MSDNIKKENYVYSNVYTRAKKHTPEFNARVKKFYHSKAWVGSKRADGSWVYKGARQVAIDRSGGVCSWCGKIILEDGIVDHIIEIDESNIGQYNIMLAQENLQYLHLACHNAKHAAHDAQVARDATNRFNDERENINYF